MKTVNYRLPDSLQTVHAGCLWEEKRNSLLFVPAVEGVRGATLVIAERRKDDGFYEDSVSNTFDLEDWSAAMIAVWLMLLVKGDAINTPKEFE